MRTWEAPCDNPPDGVFGNCNAGWGCLCILEQTGVAHWQCSLCRCFLCVSSAPSTAAAPFHSGHSPPCVCVLLQVKVADEAVLSQPGAADIARWMANAGRHQHQSILPWFWDLLSDEDLQRAPGALPGWSRPLDHPLLVPPTSCTAVLVRLVGLCSLGGQTAT